VVPWIKPPVHILSLSVSVAEQTFETKDKGKNKTSYNVLSHGRSGYNLEVN